MKNRSNEQVNETRRELLENLSGLGALALLGAGTGADVLAQAPTPKADDAIPGTVPNEAVKREKLAAMQYHSERPLTGSVPAHEHDVDVTSNDRMFIRNNLLTPDINASQHRLVVKGLVEKELTLSVEDLQRSFRVISLQAMLECAGSGRTAFVPKASGTTWLETGGMGCPRWTGVRLADVLRAAGVRSGAVHVAGEGADFGAVKDAPPFIRSIPIAKAMEDNTLLAWEMNGTVLPKVHGYPLRLVVPGWVGSASTKWLRTLTVLDAPFKGTYMDRSYVMPKYPVPPGEKLPAELVLTEAWPIKSIITAPAPNARFKSTDRITVRGKAWIGEGDVARVEVSADEGATWQRARLHPKADKYAWQTFSVDFRTFRPGYVTFLARAWDENGNAQPMVSTWNPLGYFWNGVHRVGVIIET